MLENDQNELKSLKKQIMKLKLESKLRSNLSKELDRQKLKALEAENIAKEKSHEIELIANQLSKYLSPQLYNSIFSGDKKVEVQSEKKFLTIFFSDLVSFTNISDKMDSILLTKMLNDYLNKMTDLALSYGATIDKYIGDAIMIFVGDPETEGKEVDAFNCVEMAIQMQIKMKELSNYWVNQYSLNEPLMIRIGINSGNCTVGNFGSERRLDYTVIGSPVNLASRLESLCPHGKVVVSEYTYQLIKKKIPCKKYDYVEVKGFERKFPIYLVDF